MIPLRRLGGTKATRIREKATEALRASDLSKVFEIAGVNQDSLETAGAALKVVLAEKVAACTIRAMREAKKRKMRLGAAAIIIAAQS